MSAKAPECPSCQVAVLRGPENPFFPFCSQRCRTIDLGRWLGGEYRIAAAPDEDEDGNTLPEKPPSDA